MSKFTTGPWLLIERTIYALNEMGTNIFSASVQDCHTPESVLKANAQLMVAAPDLYQALTTLINPAVEQSPRLWQQARVRAGNAIRRADGYRHGS